MKLKKAYALLAVTVLVLISFFIYKTYNKPHVAIEDTKAQISVKASEMIQDFLSDEQSANTKYLEKIIQVEGTVKEIKIKNNGVIVSLGTKDTMESILCHLLVSETDKTKNLKKGQTISVKGICTGYLLDIILIRSIIKINKK